MCATAGFHHNATSGVLSEVMNEARTSELAFEDGFAVGILSDEMKGVLADVESKECDSCHDALLK
ncbi:conserved hypothetical protein [Aeromonas salmonicida]|nr:conserved hypothetical protein [Aeromonas salmonicida]